MSGNFLLINTEELKMLIMGLLPPVLILESVAVVVVVS